MQEISWGSVPPDSPSWYAYVHTITSHKSQPPHFLFSVSTLLCVQGCAQEVISGGKFPRGIKRRGQPCACVQCTYLAGG